jgi:hypothetical protein
MKNIQHKVNRLTHPPSLVLVFGSGWNGVSYIQNVRTLVCAFAGLEVSGNLNFHILNPLLAFVEILEIFSSRIPDTGDTHCRRCAGSATYSVLTTPHSHFSPTRKKDGETEVLREDQAQHAQWRGTKGAFITPHSSLTTPHSSLLTHHSPLLTHHSSLIAGRKVHDKVKAADIPRLIKEQSQGAGKCVNHEFDW